MQRDRKGVPWLLGRMVPWLLGGGVDAPGGCAVIFDKILVE